MVKLAAEVVNAVLSDRRAGVALGKLAKFCKKTC